MTDIVLRDIDELLAERIRRIADARGWALPDALLHLLEHGLYACETGAARLDDSEADVLQNAISALEQVPDDPGFSLIGRSRGQGRDPSAVAEDPDQSISAGFSLE